MKIIEQGQKLDGAQKAQILLHGRGSTAIDHPIRSQKNLAWIPFT